MTAPRAGPGQKPSEVRAAFALAKARARREPAAPRILEFVNADDHTSRVTSAVALHRPLFEPTPAEVWIDDYTPFHTHTTRLTFRNCDTVARRLRIEPPALPCLRIRPVHDGPARLDGKVAAGMDVVFVLEFSPQEVQELAVDLICCTERERFALPIRIRGRYPALDIPDDVDFGAVCPVKLPTTRVLSVRNVGTRGAKFAFRLSPPTTFAIRPEHAVLAQGAAVQLELTMTPASLADGEGELLIQDDAGQTASVRLHGQVRSLDVYLSSPLVEPPATYISLTSRKTIKLCNDSDFPVDFAWKAFPDAVAEQEERERLLGELAAMEARELADLDDHHRGVPESAFDGRKVIETKYSHLRKAVAEDTMLFANDCLALTPLTGRVWAHSEADIVTSFSPAMAVAYSSVAFVDVGGQERRVPLQIRGQGIGPKAKVVYNEFLDFGEVFIRDERLRDFTIQNKGEIPAVYELVPLTLPDGVTFDIAPSRGTLGVNEMRKVEVSFCSRVLGEVLQTLCFRLQGSEEQLRVRFKAQVVPPVFHFDADVLDFGAVSYSFAQTRAVRLINASKIAMDFTLRIPDEAGCKKKEFQVSPSTGCLAAYGEQEILVQFTPMNVKHYDYRMVVHIAGIDAELLRLPIRAQAFVPDVLLARQELDFGACFLRYPHKATLELVNKSSHLPGRFEIGEQDEHSRAIASYNVDNFSGILQPEEKATVDVYLSCEKLGPIRLPMSIAIPGSTDLPLAVTLTATGTGPKVELDQHEVNWGSCSCLVDHERVLTMTNKSLIPATFKTFIRSARSKFQIDQKEGSIGPGESIAFMLTANLDDTIIFKDQLHILITEGENIVVPLSIKGTGTTMWSQSELRTVDFGYQMTTRECSWSCTLENKGKRSQILTWTNKTFLRNKMAQAEAAAVAVSKKTAAKGSSTRGAGGKSGDATAAGLLEEVIPVFSVFPSTIELKPRTACVFVFKGISTKSGLAIEELVCETRVGKEKNNKVAFVTELRGEFIDPKLEPTSTWLQFEYTHHPGQEISRQSQPLSLRNVCALPLSFTMRTQPPFSLDCWEAELQPSQSVNFCVEFYPGYKDDHLCRVVQGKVSISYIGHPQRDSVELIGDISFPNLSFETTKIDFGCTLNDTQKSQLVTVTNTSKVETSFRWIFIEDEQEARTLATPKKPYIPTNQVFDILPIRGTLQPGESERIEFLFYGHPNRKFKNLVACEVEGGPEYELTLLGEASSLVYKLDKQCLDFGQVLYNKTEDREFAILNTGRVPFSFTIAADSISRGRSVLVTPTTGKVAPNDRQRILVQLRPGIPEQFEELLQIEIAHFQPLEFRLFGSGIFAAVSINLPREIHPSCTIDGEHPNWRDLKKRAKHRLSTTILCAAAIGADQSLTTSGNTSLSVSDSKTTISTVSANRPGLDRGNSFVSVALTAKTATTVINSSPTKLNAQGQVSTSTIRTAASALSHTAHPGQIDDLDIEIEACRLFFAQYLATQDTKKNQILERSQHDDSVTIAQRPEHSGVMQEHRESQLTIQPTPSTTKKNRVQLALAKGENNRKLQEVSFPFVLSQFVLDFGNVVLGGHKIKKFSVINIGATPASFQIDKNLAQARGFQIEPERVVRLPEKQSVEFTVTFQARKNVALGTHQVQLPFAMKNGPPCLVTIRAVVTVPDVTISMDMLDFGLMPIGTVHTIYTQLHNPSTVPAEWAVKKPMGSAKDCGNFRIQPQNGVLGPGSKANIQVEFIPEEGRLYSLKLPIKVTANPRSRTLSLKGEGAELRVSFHPAMVELGPVFPCSGPATKIIELRNDSDYAIEVFSLDFDSTFKYNEDLTRGIQAFTSTEDSILLPLHEPGEPWEKYLVRSNAIQLPIDSPRGGPAESTPGSQDEVDTGPSESTSSNVPPTEEGSQAALGSDVTQPLPRLVIDYVIMGPPQSGKSTQARMLADRENLIVWSIDDAVRLVCLEFKNPLGRLVRRALGLGNLDSDQSEGTTKQDEHHLSQAGPEVVADDLTTNDTDEAEAPHISQLLEQIIVWRLNQPDLVRGSVLDGWENSFASFEETIQICARALTRSRVIWLHVDEDAWEALAVRVKQTQPGECDDRRRLSRNHTTPSTDAFSYQSDVEAVFDASVQPESPADAQTAAEINETNQVDEAVTDAVANAEQAVADVLAQHKSCRLEGPNSIAEYNRGLNTMRKQLQSFVSYKCGGTMDVASNDVKPGTAEHDWSEFWKQHSRSDNFVMEFTITELAPPLTTHASLSTNLEKYIKDLENSHLTVPPSAKYQLVRRPPQRFIRKPIQRFALHYDADSGAGPSQVTSSGIDAVDITKGDISEEAGSSEGNDQLALEGPVSRWVLLPRASEKISVLFESSEVGQFDCAMGFEIVGIPRREFNLFCRGTASVPQINADPRNVFMNRVKTRSEGAFVHKKFVISKNQFEFGPLIVPLTFPVSAPESEEDFLALLKTDGKNIDTFRISNCSKYPLHARFTLKSGSDTPKVFSFAPQALELLENETREIRLWACPPRNGWHEDSLICCISDNPEPVQFSISCYGCTPTVVLRGPWEQTASDATSEQPDQEGIIVSARGSDSTPRKIEANVPVLDFEQLLLKRQDERVFYVENTSAVPIIWRLNGEIPSDFQVLPVEGTLKPFQKASVVVIFTAATEAIHNYELQIQYSDCDSALTVSDRCRLLTLVLKAEAYKIDVCSFEGDAPENNSVVDNIKATRDGSLDFGLIRVGESHTRSFNIRNRGKYNIKFVFHLRSSLIRDLVKIDPMEMVVDPDKVSSIKVTMLSQQEVILRDNKDIKCSIIEMLSGESCAEFHVLTSVRAVFSKFRLQPNRGINFGPLKFNDKPRTKRLEIRNDGEFVFKYRALKVSDCQDISPLTLDTVLNPGVLTVGQFALTPDSGSIDPGTCGILDVTFQPKDCDIYREFIQLEISGRNVVDVASSDALRYELVGESCYPCINVSDYESIFEEQIVVRSLGTEMKGGLSNPSTSNASSIALQTVLFAEEERLFSFGALIAAAGAKGCVERFKISNPTKVTTTVQFQIRNSMGESGGIEESSSQPQVSAAFTVQPAAWEIPPMEHRFVNVHFKPTAIKSYNAVFAATVEDAPANGTTGTTLHFKIRGEGTMPCITVLEPTVREQLSGSLVMSFGRVRTAKTKDLNLVLRNDGILSATVLFSMQVNPNFSFAHGNGSVVVPPKQIETLIVQFKPQKVHDELCVSSIKFTVQNNAFEETTIKLSGQGYRDDVVFEDLPNGFDDELHFDDVQLFTHDESQTNVPESSVKVFSIMNQSPEVIRFEWPNGANFLSFTPSAGHLSPGLYKLITATFSPPPLEQGPTVMACHKILMKTQRISLKHSDGATEETGVSDWDDTMNSVSFDGGGTTAIEPRFESVGNPEMISLSCFAAADRLAFECDTPSIAFKRTFMLQVSTYKVEIRNKSRIRLPFSCQWIRMGPFTSNISDDERGSQILLGGTDNSDDDDCPFEISPLSGCIDAEGSQSLTVRFAPMEVDDFQYELVFNATTTQREHNFAATNGVTSSLRIPVTGVSVRPACHFDVERSDYLLRRSPSQPGPNGELGPLDPAIKVIEMESLGVRVRNTRRFYVVNPTNISYEFTWTPEGDANPCFRCATPKGLMLAGKRCEMIFEFTPQQIDLQEQFWRFRIAHFQVNQLFLFVGTTTEPRVILDRGSVNFNTLLIGTKTSQTVALVNHEHIPFNFVFDKSSLDFAGEVPALLVHPLSGVIPPHGRTTVDVEFIPMEEKSYNFNVNCIVKRKPTRLSLNVKGEGYSIHDTLTIIGDEPNDVIQAATSGGGNILDFGTVKVNETRVRTVLVHNTGKFNFDFNWSHALSSASKFVTIPSLTIEPMQGTVKKNNKVQCRLTFAPTKPTTLDMIGNLSCTIAGARHYAFSLRGTAVPPSLQFSFTSHDFGPTFIADADALPQSETVTLSIFNVDTESAVDLDCLFESKPHLRVDCPPTVLAPRDTALIPITFTARHEVEYLELVPFVINGSSTLSVALRGEGIIPKVELVNSAMQTVAFGSLQIGQQITRTVKVINRTKRKTTVEFVGDLRRDTEPELSALGINVFPQGELSLKPKETIDIEIRFAPSQRIALFQRDVHVLVAGSKRRLLTITGTCLGMDVQLEIDTISFGTVCLGSQVVRKVHLQNRGDMPARYQWNARAFAPDFTISPLEGVVAPSHHKTLEVTFKPVAVNPDIRYDRLCGLIEGADPVFLNLVGTCVNQTASSTSEVKFESRVREETMKSVVIENKTSLPWNLFPVVQGEHWSCPENVPVPAEGKATLNIRYFPLAMTKGAEEATSFDRPEMHEGSVFLAIPDGTALLFNLTGKAHSPVPMSTQQFTTPAKKPLPISIQVTNWLKVPQTFSVQIVKPGDDGSVVVQGSSSITLHGSVTRNYHLKFYSYKEGIVPVSVRFVNPDNGEYILHEIQVNVTQVAEVETLQFETPVRQSVKKIVTIENPFYRTGDGTSITHVDKDNWWQCSSPFVRVRQLSDINDRPEGVYEVEYRPTIHVASPEEGTLVIRFVELGDYVYKLVLGSQAAGTDASLYFKSPLGGAQVQTFAFTTYSDKNAELVCAVQHPTFFSVPSTVRVDPASEWEGRVHNVQVTFEPEALGEVHDTLILRSELVGEYRCALHGVAVPPLPQGPFVFTGSTEVEFKNVFSSHREFDVVVDNPKFVLSVKGLSIPAKTAKAIGIKLDASAPGSVGTNKSITGKLLVTCPSMKDVPTWVYYLEATLG